MKTKMNTLLVEGILRLFLLAWLGIALAGCGGGGGGDSSDSVSLPATLALNLEPRSVKTFRFSWADVGGVSEYRLYERISGVTSYTEIASIAAGLTSYDHIVFLPKHINADYILEACNAGGCVESAPKFVSGTLAEAVGYVKASNTGANDQFGVSVALSGDGSTLAVGAITEDSAATGINGDQADNLAPNSGAVYVFTRSADGWSQQAYLKASNTEEGDQFGFSVALSDDGNTLAVGANREDSAATGIGDDQADNSAPDSGAVYVFTRSAGSWSQQAYLKASHPGQEDGFGVSLALSGDGSTLAVGTIEDGIDGDPAAPESGAVYVFTRNADNWSEQAYLKASSADAGDRFGVSVALADDGNTLAVAAIREDSPATGIGGAQGNDYSSAANSGAVYVFTRSAGSWSQQAYVKASNTGAVDEFGFSVALAGDGNTLAVGAHLEDSAATGINGNQADDSAPDSGAVYVFTRSAGSWSQQAYVKASNTGADDRFGISTALAGDGNTLTVGAYLEDSAATGINGNQQDNTASNAGAVYVFTRSAGNWSQQAYVKAPNTGPGDGFGLSVALAGDGNTLAVGAVEDSAATGIGGDQQDDSAPDSGAVYLY